MADVARAPGVTVDVSEVVASLQGASLRGRKHVRVDVGYTAPYAVYVHEDLEASHPNGGQAKYLEQPARTLAKDMMDIIVTSVQNRNGLEEGCRRAGNLLLSTSRALVPVDTGRLRDSGYVKTEGV